MCMEKHKSFKPNLCMCEQGITGRLRDLVPLGFKLLLFDWCKLPGNTKDKHFQTLCDAKMDSFCRLVSATVLYLLVHF